MDHACKRQNKMNGNTPTTYMNHISDVFIYKYMYLLFIQYVYKIYNMKICIQLFFFPMFYLFFAWELDWFIAGELV